MSWATIRDLKLVEENINTDNPFSILSGGSNPLNSGNCATEAVIFYKEDVQALLNQSVGDEVVGFRLINTFLTTTPTSLNTPPVSPSTNIQLELTFLVACKKTAEGLIRNFKRYDDKVAITCPPVYIRKEEQAGWPNPGEKISSDKLKEVAKNGY